MIILEFMRFFYCEDFLETIFKKVSQHQRRQSQNFLIQAFCEESWDLTYKKDKKRVFQDTVLDFFLVNGSFFSFGRRNFF